MPTRDQIIRVAINEVTSRSFAVTRQYLDILKVATNSSGQPQISRIDQEGEEGRYIVYFPIADERFFLAVVVEPDQEPTVSGVGVEPGSRVYLRATSENLEFNKMCAATSIIPTDGWNRGDPTPSQPGRISKFSCFHFEPNPDEAEPVQDKIIKLVELLEKDRKGTQWLSDHANAQLQVAWYSYLGNGCLGGIHLNRHLINRLTKLGLSIDFDLYTGGKPIE
jgi:hypothetical protein